MYKGMYRYIVQTLVHTSKIYKAPTQVGRGWDEKRELSSEEVRFQNYALNVVHTLLSETFFQ